MKIRKFIMEDGQEVFTESGDDVSVRILRAREEPTTVDEVLEKVKNKVDKNNPVVDLLRKQHNKGVDKKEKKDGNNSIHKTGNE